MGHLDHPLGLLPQARSRGSRGSWCRRRPGSRPRRPAAESTAGAVEPAQGTVSTESDRASQTRRPGDRGRAARLARPLRPGGQDHASNRSRRSLVRARPGGADVHPHSNSAPSAQHLRRDRHRSRLLELVIGNSRSAAARPGAGSRSNTVTAWPARVSCCAAASPAGPLPTIATERPEDDAGGCGSHPPPIARSAIASSISRIVTGSSFSASTHASSHGAGHSRPVSSGSCWWSAAPRPPRSTTRAGRDRSSRGWCWSAGSRNGRTDAAPCTGSPARATSSSDGGIAWCMLVGQPLATGR